MGKYRVDANFKMIGGFWKFEEPDETFTGTLISRKGHIEILTAPVFSRLDTQQTQSIMVRALTGDQKRQRVQSVCGFTSQDDCTLFNSLVLENGGSTNFPKMKRVSATRYIPARTLMGLHLESAESKSIDAGAIYFTKIHQLLPTPWVSRYGKSGTSHRVPWKAKNVFKFVNADINSEIICEVFAGGNSKMKKGTSIKLVARIRIMPRQPQSVDWFASLAFRAENFFSLFLGTSVSLKRLQLFQAKADGWLVQGMNNRKEKFDFRLCVRSSPKVMADAFSKWLSVPVDKQPVELTVLGMMRKSKVFNETMFLSYAQALEGFGRIRFAYGAKKSPSFATMIQQTYALLSADFANQIVGEKTAFTTKIVQTRNYYTHLGSQKGKDAIRDSGELYLWNKRLQAFMRAVMLVDLGVPEQFMKEQIIYQANRFKLY